MSAAAPAPAAAGAAAPAPNTEPVASATATMRIAYPPLPPVFKHENPASANPAKGIFGSLARSLGVTSNNRLILKPTQIHAERFAELGYDGLFGRYYRLAQTYMKGEKVGSGLDVLPAFHIAGTIRVLFFENIKRVLRGMKPIPVNFEELVSNASTQLRTLKDIPESLRSELQVFLGILELQYDLEMRNAQRSVRERAALEAGAAKRVGVVGGTRRRRHRPRRHTRRIR